MPTAIMRLNPAQVQAAVQVAIPWAPPPGMQWVVQYGAVPALGDFYPQGDGANGGSVPPPRKDVSVAGVGTVAYLYFPKDRDGYYVNAYAGVSGPAFGFMAQQLRVNSPRGLPQS